MFWIIVMTVALVGVAVAWWLSGRARPLGGSATDHQRRLDGGGGNYYQNPHG